MSEMTRRNFLSSAGAALAATAVLDRAASFANIPKEKIRHAVIGTGGQGKGHCRVLVKMASLVEVVAVCDVDPDHRANAAALFPKPEAVQQYEDFRILLEDKSIDSVTIATPDHWHTPIALAALLAGKHVYVEKPCAHNPREAELLASAALKTGKCVAHGTQSRSSQGIRDAIQYVHEGNLGKVRMAKAINHQLREPIGREPDSDPPSGANYDLWLGPAPKRPFSKNRWHYNWHWYWDYGTGDIGNDGVHQIDQARWGLGVGLPRFVSASGGQLFYEDDHETPDTQVVTYEYEDCYLLFEMRLWTNYPMEGHDNGVVFYGDKGRLDIGRQGCVATLMGQEPVRIGGGPDFEANIRNFVEAVCADDPSHLMAPISEGAPSAMLSHLGNIATRVGRRLRLAPDELRILDDPEAEALLGRTYREGYELPKVD